MAVHYLYHQAGYGAGVNELLPVQVLSDGSGLRDTKWHFPCESDGVSTHQEIVTSHCFRTDAMEKLWKHSDHFDGKCYSVDHSKRQARSPDAGASACFRDGVCGYL